MYFSTRPPAFWRTTPVVSRRTRTELSLGERRAAQGVARATVVAQVEPDADRHRDDAREMVQRVEHHACRRLERAAPPHEQDVEVEVERDQQRQRPEDEERLPEREGEDGAERGDRAQPVTPAEV